LDASPVRLVTGGIVPLKGLRSSRRHRIRPSFFCGGEVEPRLKNFPDAAGRDVQDDEMLSNLVMTIISPDRPGLVELVASHVVSQGGNWLESRMCRLGGQFAGIVRVEVPQEKCDALLNSLSKLEKDGLQISARKESSPESQAKGTVATLELVGQDRPGILHQISRALAIHGVNVEELSSDRVDAPMDGSMLFQAHATVLLPAGVSIAQIRSELEKIATDLMVDVSIMPARG
jgi:glycine cleavage system regulatory protein